MSDPGASSTAQDVPSPSAAPTVPLPIFDRRASPDQATEDDLSTIVTKISAKDDALWRALQRVPCKTPWTDNSTLPDAAADDVLADYLKKRGVPDEKRSAKRNDLMHTLRSVARTDPEAMELMRYLSPEA